MLDDDCQELKQNIMMLSSHPRNRFFKIKAPKRKPPTNNNSGL